jgi:cellobiose-specific phosphotransferase system component IIC
MKEDNPLELIAYHTPFLFIGLCMGLIIGKIHLNTFRLENEEFKDGLRKHTQLSYESPNTWFALFLILIGFISYFSIGLLLTKAYNNDYFSTSIISILAFILIGEFYVRYCFFKSVPD